MALRIRLQRFGSRHRPFYRVVVAESSARRDGRFVEQVGTYNPSSKDPSQETTLRLDRVDYWMGCGAQPSDTVRSMIKRVRKEAPVAETAAAAPADTAADNGVSPAGA